MSTKVITISVPEYTIEQKPDYLELGKKVDGVLESNFRDQEYIIRAISSDDHPELSLAELVSTILESGTDKYDPRRKGVCHQEFSPYDHDIQADTFEIKTAKIVIDDSYKYPTLFGDLVYDFYENAPLDRGHSVRLDILMIYDTKKLTQAKKIDPEKPGVSPRLEKYLYKFKDPEHKQDALVGVVKILH